MGSRRPRSDQDRESYEKTKLRTVFFGVIAVVILGIFASGFLVQNLLAARNAGEVEWKENYVIPTSRPNLEDLKGKLAQTERVLEGVQKKQPKEMKMDIQEWLYRLDSASQEYEERGWWQQAADLLKRAIEVDNLYICEPSHEFSRRLLKNLGICFLQTKQYALAQERFQKLLEMQTLSGERGLPLASVYAYLGDSYYFQHEWQKALESYNSSLNVIENEVTKYDILAKQAPVKDTQTLLTLGRMADCELNLAETNNDYYLKSANAYHLCADSWKGKDKQDPQNYAVSLVHLAQAAQHLPDDQLQNLQKNDGPNWVKHSGKYYASGDLYSAAVSAMKEAPVKKPQVLKPMLLVYAGYLFSKFNVADGLRIFTESIFLPNR